MIQSMLADGRDSLSYLSPFLYEELVLIESHPKTLPQDCDTLFEGH
jgi:hypothetical protein